MVDVRVAGAVDARGVADVHVRSWQWGYAGLLDGGLLAALSVDEREERWRDLLTNVRPGAVTFVADVDQLVVGFVSVGPGRDEDVDDSVGELYALYLAPEVTGRGIGRLLHDTGLTRLREDGYRTARLWVLRDNVRARGFYERQGWQVEGAEKLDEFGDFVLDEVRYTRGL